MRLLITGGAGFIGSYFVEYILNRYPDYKVITIDALTYAGSLDNLKTVIDSPRHEFVHGRIEDSQLVDQLVAKVDVIVNFAAESHVDRSIAQPEAFVQSNIVGVQVLLDAARRYNVKLFYQISTDEVYGALELDAKAKFTEHSPLRPTSPYAASKAAADLLVLAYSRTYGLPVVISRCCNNYGCRQSNEKFLRVVISHALKHRPIPIYGDGRYMRDWLHVRDHCRAIDLILHYGKIGNIYNIGASNEWLNIDLAQKLLDMLDKPKELIQFVADRPAHDKRYAMDSKKIHEELGWIPEIPWEQGLRELVAWCSEKRNLQ